MKQNLSIKVALNALDRLSPSLSAAQKRSAALSVAIKKSQDSIKGIERSAKSYDNLTSKLKKTSAQLLEAQTRQKALRVEFGKVSQRTEEQRKILSELRKTVGGLKVEYASQTAKLRENHQAMRAMGVTVLGGMTAEEQITEKAKEFNQTLDAQKTRLERTTAAQEKFNKTKETATRLRNTGLKMSAAGGGVLWGTNRLMRPGVEFDQAYAETLANAQLSRSDLVAVQLRQQAKDLANKTHFSATEVTQGQNALIAGGMTANRAITATPAALNMALAGGHGHPDLHMAADVMSGTLDSWQLDASKAGTVADALTATFTRSKTSIESLGETFKYAGTQAHLSGMSFQETAAAAAMLAKNNIEGSAAGTGLQEALAGLSKDSGGVLASLHIRTVEANGAMRNTRDILGELYEKTRKFNQTSQLNIANALFGQSGARAGLILMQTAADGQWKSFLDYVNKSNGLAQKTANEMTNTFQGDLKMLDSAWQNLWTTLEEGADSPLRQVVQKLTHVIQKVSEWAGKHPHLTSVIITTTLAVAGLTTALGILLTTISTGLLGIATARLLLRLAGIGTTSLESTSGVEALSTKLGEAATAGRGLASILKLCISRLSVVGGIATIAGATDYAWNKLEMTDRLANARKNGGVVESSLARLWLYSTKDARTIVALGKSLLGIEGKSSKNGGDKHSSTNTTSSLNVLKDKVSTLASDVKGALVVDKKAGGGKPFGKDVWNPKGAGSSGASVTDPNKLGDIVFKHVPDWIRIGGGYQEPRLYKSGGDGLLSDLRQVAVNTISSFIPSASQQPAPASTVGTSVAGDMVVTFHIHDATNPQAVAKEVRHVLDELNRKNARAARSTYRDRE